MRRDDRGVDRNWLLWLTIAALALYTLNLDGTALRDWDEATVAQVAREIANAPIESLTWLFPTLQGEPYWNKPPLLHWAIALCFRLFGEGEWTARLPGALCGALTAPALYVVVRELWPRRLEAMLASTIFLTWLPVVRHGRLAMLDAAIGLFFVVAIGFTLRSRRDLRYSLGLGVAIGLMCLTKGLLGICLGGLLMVFLVWDTPRLLRQPWFWYGIGTGSIPAWSWYAMQFQRYGSEFASKHLGEQAVDRLVTSVESNGGSPEYYVFELLKYGWPWLLFAVPGMIWAWQNRKFSWGKLLIVCGLGYGLIISAMQTKLPWYVLPLYPVLAIAAGIRLGDLWQSGHITGMPIAVDRRYPHIWALGLGGLATGMVSLLGYELLAFAEGRPLLLTWHVQVTVACLAMTFGLAAWRVARRDLQFILVLVWGTYISLLSFVTSNQWNWELNENYPVRPAAEFVRQAIPPDRPLLVLDAYPRPSLAYYAERPIAVVAPDDREQLYEKWQVQPELCVLAPVERAVTLRELVRDSDISGTFVRSQDWIAVCRASLSDGAPE
ncbi:MAG: ArnT family glycosyltransferase [Geitlerinemataceae cyanobacterium]